MVKSIQQRLADLRPRPLRDLEALPAWASEEIVVDGVPAELTTYREGGGSEALRVIVQFSTKPKRFLLFFHSRQVLAEGFTVTANGAIEELPESELYDFM